INESANVVGYSRDGRWLAASTQGGSLELWAIEARGKTRPVPLENSESSGRTTTFTFTPDGRRLVSGDQDGGLRTWDLPDGNQRPQILARRGQVAGLSVSGDGRFLLQITQDRQAQVWDLKEGRGVANLDGEWSAGVLSPDGEVAYLTAHDEGSIVAVDRA